ncbi:hypothetical protein J5S49_02735 [Virgibacillus halodenitrificans]|uniref:hypothetical protein n=1 Tax=Virgibacillus halodenitrificans TaxID=1482 RepID=UPI001F1B08B8|nr:hypothetical protein [Virgibacillus halodenitrificans]MCG1027207.1 hypothetical protein [Virgibacillus halodenitrificans]
MTDKPKKKFDIPTSVDGEISASTGLQTNKPFDSAENYAGDSVDEHKILEGANEYLASKQISQINNNS